MRFKLSTAGMFYSKEQALNLEKLGFKFMNTGDKGSMAKEKIELDIGIDISTLEELIAFSNKWGDLIFSNSKIEIYDDYVE